jgi:hypothetical protein
MPKPRNRRGDFEAQITKPELSVLRPKPENPPPVLRPNREKPSPPVLRPNQRKSSEWFWGQTTHKPSTLFLRLNQETHAPSLHVPGADHTRCHPTSQPPDHRVSDMCDHPRSSALGLLLLSLSSSLHVVPHLPPAHHETRKHDSLNKTKVKQKQNKPILIWIQISSSQWLITIKPSNWPLGFSSSLMIFVCNTPCIKFVRLW